MALPTIVSNDDVRDYLGKTSFTTPESTLLAHIKPGVEAAVRHYVRSNITQKTYTHYLPQNYAPHHQPQVHRTSRTLRTPQFPIRSITSVHEDPGARGGTGPNAFEAASELTEGEDFYQDLNEDGLCWFGHLIRLGSNWPAEPRCVRVVYSAGFSDDELDGSDDDLDASQIKLATLMEIAAAWHRQDRIAEGASADSEIQRENLEGHDVTYRAATGNEVSLTGDVKTLLNRFRRRNV